MMINVFRMTKRFKSYAVLFLTLLTLCAFVMPCVQANAHGQVSSEEVSDTNSDFMVLEKNDTSQGHDQGKSAKFTDHCCIAHHCCSAKVPVSLELKLPLVRGEKTFSGHYIDQVAFATTLSTLDRPPKRLV